MKKPRPGTATLDCVCWLLAETHYDGMAKAHREAGLDHGTLEVLADLYKEWILSGELRIVTDKNGDRFTVVPAVMTDARGSA